MPGAGVSAETVAGLRGLAGARGACVLLGPGVAAPLGFGAPRRTDAGRVPGAEGGGARLVGTISAKNGCGARLSARVDRQGAGRGCLDGKRGGA